MPQTIITLDIPTGSYVSAADDVTINGENVSLGGSLTVTGSAYFKNIQVDNQPISISQISGSLTKLADGTSYLLAGENVQISSSSNGAVTISSDVSATAGGVNVVAYNGYCQGSLLWNSTTWADFHTVPSSFVNRIQNGITRSNSTFTVVSGGIYFFHADFVHANELSWTGLRLSGSSGTIIQQTVGSYIRRTDGDGFDLAGVFPLSAGESFKLQYAFKSGSGGSANTWVPSDPHELNAPYVNESMRTGVITIFRLGDA